MIESYKQSIEEFKRVDHLFYVTLKYTRTVDVIRSVIERLISTFEYAIDSLLKCMKEEKDIDEIPSNPVGKGKLAKEKCEDPELCKYLDLYLKLRKILRENYTKREEYRRHVTMVTSFEGNQLNVDIDLLKDYYDEIKKFLTYVKSRIEVYRDD